MKDQNVSCNDAFKIYDGVKLYKYNHYNVKIFTVNFVTKILLSKTSLIHQKQKQLQLKNTKCRLCNKKFRWISSLYKYKLGNNGIKT